MKKTILTFMTIFALYGLHAQEKTSIINLQAGVGGSASGAKIKTPAFYGSYEYFLNDTFSLGAIVGYSTLSVTTTKFVGGAREVEENTDNIVVGALSNYYLVNDEKFKFYTGLGLGYASGKTAKFLYELHAGAKYALSDSFMLNSEVGIGLSLLKVGVSFNL